MNTLRIVVLLCENEYYIFITEKSSGFRSESRRKCERVSCFVKGITLERPSHMPYMEDPEVILRSKQAHEVPPRNSIKAGGGVRFVEVLNATWPGLMGRSAW
jgi:hypothetical protein